MPVRRPLQRSRPNRERDEEDPPVFLDGAELLEAVPASGQLAIQFVLLSDTQLDDDAFARARAVLDAHPGAAPVEVVVGEGNGLPAPRLRSRTLRVDAGPETLAKLKETLGPKVVALARVRN